MRHVPNNSIRDAFMVNDKAKVLMVEAKRSLIRERIQAMSNLAHETFCGSLVPEGSRKRFDLYFQSKSRIRELGVKGGVAYQHAMTRLKAARSGMTAWERQQAFRDAVDAVVPLQ